MKRQIFAVCDLETDYAYRFMEYLTGKKHLPFEIQAFTDPKQLLDYAQTHPIEILLISEKAFSERIRKLPVELLMILSEGAPSPELKEYPSTYKYQSSDAVIREVMTCYGEEVRASSPSTVCKSSMELLAVYSPLGRVLKTSFALTLGQLLAKERAVLYLNLEGYSGFEYLFSQSYERNLGDLLYYLRQSNVSLIHKLHGMVQTVNNLDYLPPALSPKDIQGTSCQQWCRLFEILEYQSAYETVILDLGDGVDGLFRILEHCDRIYMPVRRDRVSRGKIQQFENLLRLWDCVPVLEKIEKLHLPYHAGFGEEGNYAEQLPWSELGDFVRELLRKEKR